MTQHLTVCLQRTCNLGIAYLKQTNPALLASDYSFIHCCFILHWRNLGEFSGSFYPGVIVTGRRQRHTFSAPARRLQLIPVCQKGSNLILLCQSWAWNKVQATRDTRVTFLKERAIWIFWRCLELPLGWCGAAASSPASAKKGPHVSTRRSGHTHVASAEVGIFVLLWFFVIGGDIVVVCNFFLWESGFFWFFLRLSSSFWSDPCSLPSPMLRSQEMNRKNWKKGERSEVALLEKVHMSWEACRPLSQGVGEGAQSHAQRKWRNFSSKVLSETVVRVGSGLQGPAVLWEHPGCQQHKP